MTSMATIEREGVDPWDLVRAAQEGDHRAFGLLYRRFSVDVFRFACGRLRDEHAAEDVTSETFLRALRSIGSVRYFGSTVRAWLLTIAKNIIRDHIKSGRYRHEVMVSEFSDEGRTAVFPEFKVLSEACRDEIVRQMLELSDDQRTCLLLRFFEGLSVTETAQVMKRKDNAVRALQHRAVRRLADLVDPVAVA
ncbi:sigma-70 family RNA polymerase sigma factor [Amycolatopsis sp. SID8362]|uniref:RNA polymerase sigma factor n=1 Tax=Amycolatopsis sp. SID8362 TaxID=2690346 RepID=UPI00136CCA6C|nr:sigma-70 family RNA polymerase sigma factor [Amycolatopsis sp. SID8362]NBH07474.1 sigma-70 family RNA polymerase sigma factor [Amycolatopsis sp. SID8362]NED44170.1 sigma-70 family RNA polymerase sigma factor [Amycolatopsis sp. SID8362]